MPGIIFRIFEITQIGIWNLLFAKWTCARTCIRCIATSSASPIPTAEEQWCMEIILLLMLMLMLEAWRLATRNLIHFAECSARAAEMLLRLVTSGRAIELKILCNMELGAHIQFSLCQKSLDLITEFTAARVVSTMYNRISDDRTSSENLEFW